MPCLTVKVAFVRVKINIIYFYIVIFIFIWLQSFIMFLVMTNISRVCWFSIFAFVCVLYSRGMICEVLNNMLSNECFVWHSYIFLKITFSSEVLILSDIRPFRDMIFYNLLTPQGSSFCNLHMFWVSKFLPCMTFKCHPRRLSHRSKYELSSFSELSQGVRQGCPLSLYILSCT